MLFYYSKDLKNIFVQIFIEFLETLSMHVSSSNQVD